MMQTPVRYKDVPIGSYRSVLQPRMKLYVAVLCIVLLQGVHVNCQSSYLDSAVSTLNSAYNQYRSGQLVRNILQKAREYVSSGISKLVQLQNFIDKLPSLSLPSLPSLPQVPQSPPARGRTGAWPQWSG
nr:uncharacterized protein LOC106690723 [Halyomorpha halys]